MKKFTRILFTKFNLQSLTLILLILAVIIFQQSCNKSGVNNSSSASKLGMKNAISDTNTVEKPLAEYVQEGKNSRRESNTASSACGAYFNGTYGGSGFYTYPDKPLDLTSVLNGSQISISVSSYDVPNRFTIYDANGSMVATSGWMGYASYSGPWGQSLSQTVETMSLTFIKANPGTYTLRVETSTQSYSDSWNASIACSNTGYSGSDLFKAIYFFEGDAASRIPYFSSMRSYITEFNSTQVSQRENFNTEITNIVNNLNPSFLTELHDKIYSNNLDTINSVIDQGAGLLLTAVINSSYNQNYQTAQSVGATIDTSKYDFNTIDGVNAYLKDYGNLVSNSSSVVVTDQRLCVFFAGVVAVAVWDAAAVVNYAVIINAAAVAVVYAAVYAKVKFWPKLNNFTVDQLQRETLINQISQNISTNTSN